jgi:hypothetical protein
LWCGCYFGHDDGSIEKSTSTLLESWESRRGSPQKLRRGRGRGAKGGVSVSRSYEIGLPDVLCKHEQSSGSTDQGLENQASRSGVQISDRPHKSSPDKRLQESSWPQSRSRPRTRRLASLEHRVGQMNSKIALTLWKYFEKNNFSVVNLFSNRGLRRFVFSLRIPTRRGVSAVFITCIDRTERGWGSYVANSQFGQLGNSSWKPCRIAVIIGADRLKGSRPLHPARRSSEIGFFLDFRTNDRV